MNVHSDWFIARTNWRTARTYCASIELVRTNCVPIQLRCKINIWVSVNVTFDIYLILFSLLVYTWLQLGYIKVSQSLMKLLYKHVAYGMLRNVAYMERQINRNSNI